MYLFLRDNLIDNQFYIQLCNYKYNFLVIFKVQLLFGQVTGVRYVINFVLDMYFCSFLNSAESLLIAFISNISHHVSVWRIFGDYVILQYVDQTTMYKEVNCWSWLHSHTRNRHHEEHIVSCIISLCYLWHYFTWYTQYYELVN